MSDRIIRKKGILLIKLNNFKIMIRNLIFRDFISITVINIGKKFQSKLFLGVLFSLLKKYFIRFKEERKKYVCVCIFVSMLKS